MLYIETKPLLFTREDIQKIIQDKHNIFKRSSLFSWECKAENKPQKEHTINIPLSFYEIDNPFKCYHTECLIEGPNLNLKYFRVPTVRQEKNTLNEALNYIETYLESPHKEVLLKLLKKA